MKRIFTLSLLLVVLTFTSKLSAQFTESDIKFWVGEGAKTSILVLDFRDETTDPSFAWGFRYDGELTFLDMLVAIDEAEPEMTVAIGGFGFLADVVYNHHSRLVGQPDYWSTWSGDSLAEMYMNQGTSEALSDGRWYGASYGFDPEAVAPTVAYPAYSSAWFAKEEVDFWVGTGTNEAVVVIDFNVESNETVSYAWGIKYNSTITKAEALNLIDAADANLQLSITNDQISSITYGTLAGVATNGNEWNAFDATNMSGWFISEGLMTDLSNGKWFGLTYGDDLARRPFTPSPAQNNQMGVVENEFSKFVAYPNPATSIVNIQSDFEIQKTEVISVTGQVVKSLTQSNSLTINDLNPGIYFIKVYTEKGNSVQKIIKK